MVANTAKIFTEDVADIAVGLLIDLLRKISAGDKFVRAGLWSTQFPLGYKVRYIAVRLLIDRIRFEYQGFSMHMLFLNLL